MSHGNRAHSAFKPIPKMEQDRKVKVDYNGEICTVHFGINSIQRKILKKIHSKKRRQYFKKMDTMPT
jgi:hypothetical protein